MKTLHHILAIVVLIAAAGCQDNTAHKKKEISQHWNRTRASVQFGIARQNYEQNNLAEARKAIDESLALDGSNLAAMLLSAQLSVEQNQLERAVAMLEVIRSVNADLPEPDYLAGLIYERWQQMDKALHYYQSAWTKKPDELAYLMAYAETLVALGRDDEALLALREKVDYFEYSGAIRDAIAQLLSRRGEYDAAIELFRRAAILEGHDPAIRQRLAFALFQSEKYLDVVDVVERLLSEDTLLAQRVDLQLMLGESLMKIGRAADARKALDIAVQLAPASAGAWASLAKVAVETGDRRQAALALHKCLSIDPAHADALLLRGYLYFQDENYTEALTYFSKSSTLQSADAVSLCMVGLTLERLGRHDEATGYYGRALQLKPNDPLANRLMGSLSYAD